MMTISKCSVCIRENRSLPHRGFRNESIHACVDAFHEQVILERPFEAHLRSGARSYCMQKVTIHRPIAADVDDTGDDQPRHTPAPRPDTDAVRLEGDDAQPSE